MQQQNLFEAPVPSPVPNPVPEVLSSMPDPVFVPESDPESDSERAVPAVMPASVPGTFSLPAGVRRGLARSTAPAAWQFSAFAGRFSEISGGRAGAPLTLLFRLIHEAQSAGEPVAWIGREDSVFFPPDAADAGVDLDALVVVHTQGLHTTGAAKAADHLLRSGAFGLVVMDLGASTSLSSASAQGRGRPVRRNSRVVSWNKNGSGRGHRMPGSQRLPLHIQTRLVGLAKKHGAALICLTEKEDRDPSIGSLVSLRAQVERAERIGDRYRCRVQVLKDKRSGPGWVHHEICRGPDGLC